MILFAEQLSADALYGISFGKKEKKLQKHIHIKILIFNIFYWVVTVFFNALGRTIITQPNILLTKNFSLLPRIFLPLTPISVSSFQKMIHLCSTSEIQTLI
jgi:hypothetical protein